MTFMIFMIKCQSCLWNGFEAREPGHSNNLETSAGNFKFQTFIGNLLVNERREGNCFATWHLHFGSIPLQLEKDFMQKAGEKSQNSTKNADYN